MPQRHRGRFSRLEQQLRAAGGVAKEGSELGNFKLFREGEKHATRRKTTKLSAAQRKRYGVSLAPFNKVHAAADTIDARFVGSISGFSLGGQQGLGLTDVELGWEKMVDATGKSAETTDTYFPALIKPFQATNTTGETVTSGITGNKYSYKPGNSYSIPFGRRTATIATDAEEDRRVELAEKCKAATNPAESVGYDPEVFRGSRAALAEVPGVAAAP